MTGVVKIRLYAEENKTWSYRLIYEDDDGAEILETTWPDFGNGTGDSAALTHLSWSVETAVELALKQLMGEEVIANGI